MSLDASDAVPPAPIRLLVACPDRPGIIAAISTLLAEHAANIVSSAQHSTDPAGGTFLLRMVFRMDRPAERLGALHDAFAERVAGPFAMRWQMRRADQLKRMALLVSRYEHCLLDLLWRWRRGELEADITMVISNHPDLGDDVRAFGVRFEHVPVARGAKAGAEARMLELLAGEVDLVVLARYMQILSGAFLADLGAPVINIHHSFLPAFAGADPYRRARDRGVKIIGATAHYVTEQLDAGPIVEQDVQRVSHDQDVAALTRTGEDIERAVLARAVRWHLEDRILVHDGTTVVF